MKRLCALVLALLLILPIACPAALAADDAGTPKHIPRVVSIVFDDSASMYIDTDRWAYASYAMQAFCAMMGEEDVLYVTYLNARAGSVTVELSAGSKQKAIDSFASTMFGGGTPDKIAQGAACLTEAYKTYKTNAKYYLVVMADGDLDNFAGVESVLPGVASKLKSNLSGADAETMYFFMRDGTAGTADPQIRGVTTLAASSGAEIVDKLKTVSAEIMGRTDVTADCKVQNGRLSFTLKYPALSITLFAQKPDGTFTNVRLPLTKDGKSASYDVDTYYVACPTEIVKNPAKVNYDTDKAPENPPSGFVSLITNGDAPLPKGSYSIDLSAYGIAKENLVVLAEPAVRIGCKYYLGDSETPLSFADLKSRLREGDTVTVQCGLYEIGADGSLGEAVPEDVLSPEYQLYVNGQPITKTLAGADNAYLFTVSKDFAEKELKIEASLTGYQPFVLREKFGQLATRPVFNVDSSAFASSVTLTKPLWQDWTDGDGEIVFPMEKADASLLSDLAIQITGCDALADGVCADLTDCVRIEGSSIVYAPKPVSGAAFGNLPDGFTVALWDSVTDSALAEVQVNVVQPQYRLETDNQLAGETLSPGLLKSNTKHIRFTLTADYEGDGSFVPAADSGCESDISCTLDAGDLPGEITKSGGAVRFVPQYDAETDTGISPAKIFGAEHTVSAAAAVDGVTVCTETVSFSVGNAAYKITVENGITAPFTLDTVKTNSEKIVFRVLADYEGDGTFAAPADWDTAAYEGLTIDTGKIPGRFETEYDAAGKPVGKSFTPIYDENNNGGLVFTEVAGRVHTVTATLAGTDAQAETTFEVLAPKYEVTVQKDGITLVDIKLIDNEQGVEFVISRNDRRLNAEELAGLAPYALTLSRNEDSMTLSTEVKTAADGTAYLFCKPGYDGWTFISPNLWNWMSLFTVRDGDMDITLSLGEAAAAARLHIDTDEIAWIILWVVLAVIAVTLWILFCYLTRIRFTGGTFYRVTFKPDPEGRGWHVSGRTLRRTNKGKVRTFFRGPFFLPFSRQKRTIRILDHKACFETQKGDSLLALTSLPHWVSDKYFFNTGILSDGEVLSIIRNDADFFPKESTITGMSSSHKEDEEFIFKMDRGHFLAEKNPNGLEITIIFFVSKKHRKELFAQ